MKEFFRVESLGVCCAPKCGTCECGKLMNEYKNLTIAEEKEMNVIKRSLQYNVEEGYWVSDHPWILNPNELPNNFKHALRKLKVLEKRLISSNQMNTCNEEILNMIERNVARKLSTEEIANTI